MAEAWASYRDRVVPAGAPPLQVQECRRAFYAGAHALFHGVLAMVSPGDEVTDADVSAMEALERELDAFADDVLAGRA